MSPPGPSGALREGDGALEAPDRGARGGRWACCAFLVLAWGYTALRAQRLSLTHDEALTYLIHVPASFRDILLHTQNIQSNNHLLNTLLIKSLVPFLGDSELVLRIPALLGHALYLLAVYRILTLFQSGMRLVAGTILLATNPMLLDFFSCARGYALGLGCAALGLFELLRRCVFPERRTLASGFLCVVPFAGSVLANVAFAYLFGSALLTLVLAETMVRPRGASFGRALLVTARSLGLPLVVALGLLAGIYTPAVIERIRGNLTTGMTTWGGSTGFWADTVGSLVTCVLHGKQYFGTATEASARGLALLALLGAAVVLVQRARKCGVRDGLVLAMVALLLPLCWIAAGMKLQFAWSGTRYTLDRGAIYLIPPFLLLVVLGWEALRSAGSRWGHALGAFVALLIGHGLLCANVTHHFLWQYDATTREALLRVRDEIGDERLARRRYRLGVNWLYEPAVHYYLARERLDWIEPPDRRGPDGTFDYYYVREEDRAVLERRKLQVLEVFPVSGGILAKP